MDDSKRNLSGVLGTAAAGAVVIAFAIGTFNSLKLPDAVLPPAEPIVVVEDPSAPREREYLRLRHAITANFPELGGVLRLEIAIAIDEDASRAVRSELEDDPARVVAPLAEVLLSLGATIDPSLGFAELRAQVPGAFADTLNDRFEAMGEERAVLEILIMQFSIGG